MLKISNSDFKLRYVKAISQDKMLRSGSTNPFLVLADDGLRYVIKYRESNRLKEPGSVRELLGAWAAKEIDLKVPETVIIEVSQQYVDILEDEQSLSIAKYSLGYNFGSEYLSNAIEFNYFEGLDILNKYKTELQKIFLFDMLIGNIDRRKEKPNFLFVEDEIVLIDHELAFSFLFDFSPNKTPWIFTANEELVSKNHIFFDLIKGSTIDKAVLEDVLHKLEEAFWDLAETKLPNEWMSADINTYLANIKNRFSLFTYNSDTLYTELNRLLL